MPAILPAADFDTWLDPATPKGRLLGGCRHCTQGGKEGVPGRHDARTGRRAMALLQPMAVPLRCLRRYKAVWALPDQAWMPSPLSVVQRLDAVTGPFAYVRLLGDREAVDALTKTLDHVVIDRGGQVAA